MYLNYFLHKGKVCIKYLTDGGVLYDRVDYTPSVFCYSKQETPIKTIYGKSLERLNKNSDSYWDTREMIKTYSADNFPLFGYNKTANEYVYKMFKDQKSDHKKVNICYIDIETECENGFPKKDNPIELINIITVYSSKTKKYHTFYVDSLEMEKTDDVIYHSFTDEKSMLIAFMNHWVSDYCDIITGWYIEGFDIPYLYARIVRLFNEEFANKLSPFGLVEKRTEKAQYGNEDEIKVTIKGISILDYLPLYKKYSKKVRESYKLDYIAKVELKQEKLKHSSKIPGHLLYKDHFKDFIDYNVQDVRLIVKLEEKVKMLQLAIIAAYVTFCNFDDVFSNMRLLDNLIYMYLKDRNILFSWNTRPQARSSFDGGAVKDTIPGKFKWVVSFDVTSEYPSLIRALNISPETVTKLNINTSIDKILSKTADHSEAKKHDFTIAPNGSTYHKKKKGFLPGVVTYLFEQKEFYKKKKVQADKDKDKVMSQEYDNYSNAFKVLANSLYGILGNPYYRFYDIVYAEAITHGGQALVKWVMNDINAALMKLMGDSKDRAVASDTDSVYFTLEDIVVKKFGTVDYDDKEALKFVTEFADKNINGLIEKSIKNFSDYLNCYEPEAIEMKREIISDVSVFIAKKRYIMSVLNKEGAAYEREEEIKITGVEAVKSSTPEICRDEMENAFKVILFKTEPEYHEFISNFYKKFKTLKPDEIAENKTVSNINKYLDNKGNYIKGTPINSRAAIGFNKLVDKLGLKKLTTKIRDNDKMKYLYMKVPNPLRENVFGWINELPEQMNYLTDFIDYDTQFDKVFRNSISDIASIAGYKEQSNTDEISFL